ncbi:hypothetical protein [Sporomusa termitida]|uniref:Lipoprotein n=1 Tax=Sporomusa termitida TaxID=2377 RepID=A0A517DZ40_9FIRM|nr:hypothetical protein [Sporomusa termitida]QDR82612.1 hypothetical protein SPTER_40400 [Sporomusa termitida]
MKKLMLCLLIMLCFMFAVSVGSASANSPATEASVKQVLILPHINSTEETKEYIGETVQENFTQQFANEKYQTVPADKVQSILSADQYDPSNLELPDNELMRKLAQATGADYVIAMEIVHFMNSRHASFFSTSAKSEVKIRYKVYSKGADKITTFQTTGKGNNKVTSIGVPGIGTAMKRGITEAMEAAFVKIEKL